MPSFVSTFFWITFYLGLVLAPLSILLSGPMPAGSGFWWDFSMALGFTGMAMMGVQFLLTARFPFSNVSFGIDIIYFFHRYLAVMALVIIFLHVAILFTKYPESIGSLTSLQGPWHMRAGAGSLLIFSLMIICALWRKPLGLLYEKWRLLHIVFAVSACSLALGHIEGVSYYLAVPAQHTLWHMYTFFFLLLIFYVRVLKPWLMYKKPYHVTKLHKERDNSWTMTLEPDGFKRLSFKPGQFAWLTLRASPWHIKEHPFSISSSAETENNLEFTVKELGDFTRTIKQTSIGQVAYLDGPYGAFSIDRHPQAPGFIFIAGGIGIAPIMSMLRTMRDRGDRRPIWLIYGTENWHDTTFREELEALKDTLTLHIIHVIKNPPEGWTGETGYITAAILTKYLSPETQSFEYFLCGPKEMSNLVQHALRHRKIPLKNIHCELFDMV